MTVRLTLELPDTTLGDEFANEDVLAREILLAALVKWYEQGRVSAGWAAKAAGMSRSDFLQLLGSYGVPAIQTLPEDVLTEALNARKARI